MCAISVSVQLGNLVLSELYLYQNSSNYDFFLNIFSIIINLSARFKLRKATNCDIVVSEEFLVKSVRVW
jgi:hypothetical protein